MKLLQINKDGKILGWYDDEISHEIPADAIKITDEEFNYALSIFATHYLKEKFIHNDERTPEQKNEFSAFKLLNDKNKTINNLQVTYKDVIYQADEVSQDRINRNINAMNDTDTVQWVSYNNDVHTLNKEDLKNILALACEEMTKNILYFKSLK